MILNYFRNKNVLLVLFIISCISLSYLIGDLAMHLRSTNIDILCQAGDKLWSARKDGMCYIVDSK